MTRLQLAVSLVFLLPSHGVVCQARPGFCAQPQDADLKDLHSPYSQRQAPDGTSYCEGLLPKPIAAPPPSVVSLKQEQLNVPSFKPGSVASLTWCDDDPQQAVHISLRSMVIPLFALDAQHSRSFSWRTDLVSRWQPTWNNLAATATREITINGNRYTIFVPVRIGPGNSDTYSFVIRSDDPVPFSKALIQSFPKADNPVLLDVSVAPGPTSNTSLATLHFSHLSPGVYRVTFQAGSLDAPRTTVPIYVLHNACSSRVSNGSARQKR